MRATTILRRILSLQATRVTSVRFHETGIEVGVAPTTRVPICSGCGSRARRVYDRRKRRWRHLDLAGMETTLVYEQRRVDCRRCQEVRVELVPWADANSAFTCDFEDQVAYLAQVCDRTAVSKQMRIAWVTVGNIVKRVVERLRPGDRLDGLENIGIDELSYRRHHEYVTIVIDHDRRRVVWADEGKDADTAGKFFTALGSERAAKLKTVSTDMSKAYIQAVREGAPGARIVFDRFHVQRLAHDALDEVRREQARALGGTEDGRVLKKTRTALQKNPWNLTKFEKGKISEVQRTNKPLFRAYMLKESLAAILDGGQINVARANLNDWLIWARRSQLKPFRKLAKTITRHLEGILAYIATGLSNGRTEGINGKVRTITRRAYGFHSATNLIAFIFLCCTGITLSPVFKAPDLHPHAI